MVYSLEDLEALARLNLDERGYLVYKHILKPNIESMLQNYLKPWQDTEANVFALCLHQSGANKSEMKFILEIGKGDISDLNDMVDIDKYQELPGRFKERIKYLHDSKVIGDNLFALLGTLNRRRNRIHDLGGQITDEERQKHEQAANALHWIMTFIGDSGLSEEFKTATLRAIEDSARNLLQMLKSEM